MSNKKKDNYTCIIQNLLYYGDMKLALKDEELSKLGIKAIICLLPKEKQITHDNNKFKVLNINTRDFITCSLNDWAEQTSNFIEENINNNKPVYVHCAFGISRSTSCILHYLMTKKNMNLKDSFNFVRSKRQVASPTIGFFKDLVEYDKKLFGKNSMTVKEYSIMMIKETFPKLNIEDIEKVYNEYEELYNGANKDKYKEEMEENKYEPIGYHTINNLIDGIGKGKYVGKRGVGIHHPFD